MLGNTRIGGVLGNKFFLMIVSQNTNIGEDEDQTVQHLFQKLSLLLMRGNSALLINRVPVADFDPEVGGWE